MTLQDLPAINASLNGLSAILLTAGFVMIKRGRKRAHAGFMVGALVTSAIFLTLYLSYHLLKEGTVTRFPTEYPTARIIYLFILGTHSVLAMINLPMVVLTVIPAVRQRFDRHRRLARWTWPIWIYVSVTGVLVYLMLYQWFPPPA